MSDPQRPFDGNIPGSEIPREPVPSAPQTERPTVIGPVEARQGTTLGRTRYILAISLFTIAIIFLILWLVIARL